MHYLSWPAFANTLTVTSTRTEGFSTPPYDRFNLALHVGDNEANVIKNRDLFWRELNIDPQHVVLTHQSHSTVIKKVSLSDGGRGVTTFKDGIESDALYTSDRELYLGIYHADCLPVFFSVPSKNIVGIIHAGVAGTLKEVTKITINKVMHDENVNADDIYFYFGPVRTFGHSLISATEASELIKRGGSFRWGVKATNGAYFFDTLLINFLQLRELGVPASNINSSFICTYEDKERFYSARRDETTGRMISLIGRK